MHKSTIAAQLVSAENISVVIPVYRGGNSFRHALSSLSKQTISPGQIIAVIDRSDSSALDEASASHFGAEVLLCETHIGAAAARNKGAKRAWGQVILFVDADVTVPFDLVEHVALKFCDESLSAAFGCYDETPDVVVFLSQFRNLLHCFTHANAEEIASTFWTGFGAVRREIFEALGGFDEKQRTMEDIEFGYRLCEFGHPIRLVKSWRVKHLKHWTFSQILYSDIFGRAIPWTELILARRGRFINDLNLRTSQRVSVVLSFVIFFLGSLSLLNPVFMVSFFFAFCGLLWINANFYHFLYRAQGGLFMCKALFWHWFYFIYCGVGFFLGAIKFYWSKRNYNIESVVRSEK